MMKELIENENLKPFFKAPSPGDIVESEVIGKEKSALFLEVGNFGTGVVSGQEFFQVKNELRDLKLGDKISAKVLSLDTEEGFIQLSIAEAREEKAWLELKKRKSEDQALKVKILKANKGGLLTKIKGIPTFLPVSHLSAEHYPRVEDRDQSEILKRLQKFIGQELTVKILSLNQKQKSIIVSEKTAELENKMEVLKKYQVGDVVKGEITGITDFGAFIRFPLSSVALAKENASTTPEQTLEGLIHISELDWQLIRDPSEVVEVGKKVSAKIIEISKGKISLSLKALKEDPWKDLEYKKGDELTGEVIKFNPFGVFVKITPKIQALCHISEFKNEKEMKEMLKIGKKYKFQISFINPEEHKMILKLTGPPEEKEIKETNEANAKPL